VSTTTVKASDVEEENGPACPECGEWMPYYGSSAGFIHCGYKVLYRRDGWFSGGVHVRDDRLTGGVRDVSKILQGGK
jgi:hypothetical protein